MKSQGETSKAYYQVKEANLKRLHTVWFQQYDALKGQNYGNSKRISGCQGGEGERDEQAEHRGFLGQWKYSV